MSSPGLPSALTPCQAPAADADPGLAPLAWEPVPLEPAWKPVAGHDARRGHGDGPTAAPQDGSDGWPWLEAVRAALPQAGGELVFMAPNLHGWPLGDPRWLEALGQSGTRGARLRWLTQDDRHPQLAWPRFWMWLSVQSHRWQAGWLPEREGAQPLEMPHAVLCGGQAWVGRPWDPWRGTRLQWRTIASPQERQALQELADAFSQRAEPTWQLTTLGL